MKPTGTTSRAERATADLSRAIETLMVALEAHLPGCEAHSRRTADYAAVLACRMKMNPGDVEIVRRAGFFHDIGKIGIPDRLLRKPETLKPRETKIMRRHPEIGRDLLRGFSFPRAAADAVHAHHEWFDGAGYPRALKGKDIPPMARIIAVADVYDILRAGRNYQPAVSREEAEKTILAVSGTQFDPAIVEAFRTCAAEFNALFESAG
ncbi:MAG: HD domain-containing protein [Verrucomicrobiota bacterium]|nr:HD domain-containing protein [Verrucomicrobiota bacterium]